MNRRFSERAAQRLSDFCKSRIGVSNAEELLAVPDPSPQRDPLLPHLNVTAVH